MSSQYEYDPTRISGSGEVAEGTAGAAIANRAACYLGADGLYYQADADAAATMPAVALAMSAMTVGQKGEFLVKGFIGLSTWAWTTGSELYISGTAGQMSHVAGATIQQVGIAYSATQIFFNPSGYGTGAGGCALLEGDTAYVGFDSCKEPYTNYFYCDGTVDDVQINQAITYVNGLGGGSIFLERGNYDIAATITLYSDITLRGAGKDGTILTASTANLIMLFVRDCSEVVIEHLTIDGDGQGRYAVALDNTQHSTFYNLFITNIDYDNSSWAINVFGGGSVGEHSTWNLFKDIYIYDCYHGVRISRTVGSSWSNANWFENVFCGTIQGNAFDVEDNGTQDDINFNKFHLCGAQNADYGFIMGGTANNVLWCFVASCTTQECQDEGDRNEWWGYDTSTINETVASTRIIINGQGDNGSNDPNVGGDWNTFGFEGLIVKWDDGTDDYFSIYTGATWYPINLTHEIFMANVDPDGTLGDHPVVILTDGATVDVYNQILIPLDFRQLVSAQVIVVPNGTGDMRWQCDTDFGKICANENYNTHSDSVVATDTAVTQNELECMDISGALTGLAAGDLVGVKFTRLGGHANDTVNADCYYMGIRVRYV